MINSNQFEGSFYYIAPGFDFEPLFRFSNLCTTFFYANLYYSKQEVLSHLSGDLDRCPYLEILSINEYDDFDETSYFELHPDYRMHLSTAISSFTEEEKKDYKTNFVPALKEKQWMIEVDLIRKGVDRSLKLYYFTGEGLASYIALSHNGKYTPKVLCTIQTGMLEHPNKLITRFLKQTEKLPDIWVRGFEGNPPYDYQRDGYAFNRDELFDVPGMNFIFSWYVNAIYTTRLGGTNQRYCKAYITREVERKLLSSPYRTYGSNEICYQRMEDIDLTAFSGSVLVIISSNMKNIFPPDPTKRKVRIWEDELEKEYQDKVSVLRSLEYLHILDTKKRYDHIFFVPFGLEDEGSLMDDFLCQTHHAAMHLVVSMPLDLPDLRLNSL